ncbi:hypothetical protein [Azospirillum sp. TSO22-1]|uniref:hypothetical protein n=1 Tax=Azospirillum sp. TSO22-1 TaxID=716789 RepID=UPI000D6214B7|nr:hypothetical protein [Azospirillum sp. TSO22-1]PWC52420.1 hypothetical protein TSO221_14420 [Azospirillum sp. TSO22-1]
MLGRIMAGHGTAAEGRRVRVSQRLLTASILIPPAFFAMRKLWVGFAFSVGLFILALFCVMLGKPWQNAVGFAYLHALAAAVLRGFR